MADVKISGLPAATTPLAGTEVLPIVQSGSTVKVTNNDLRPKQIQSNATSGVLQIVGPAAAATRVMTVPDANFTAARTDAANSFTADQTLSTGNLIQGTAAKGVNFTANTPAAGKTSQLLNWYEEGTWTPSISSDTVGNLSVSYSTQSGNYTRIGRLVTITFNIVTSAFTWTTASGNLIVSGLPFTVNSSVPYSTGSVAYQGIQLAGYSQVSTLAFPGQTYLIAPASNPGTNQSYANIQITDLPSGGLVILRGTITYIV